MSIQAIVTTIAGGFLFPFLISLLWGRMVEAWGPIGGWMAAGFIVGTMWLLNHGAGLIVQGANAPWVDMAWAAGIGLLAGGIYSGASFGKALPTVIYAIIGGILGGFILSCMA